MRKKGGKIILLFASLISLIVLILFISSISAIDYCISPTLTDVSPSSVGINEEFTVGILLDNCGDLAPKTINFELKDISQDIFVKESLTRNITKVGYAADRFLLYHMKTSDTIKPGEYYINYKLEYSGKEETIISKEGSFMITVIGDKAELSIASVKTKPTLPREKETVELTLRIENFGEGTANSIKVKLDHPFSGSKESFIGTLESDEDGPAVFTFVASKKGEYAIPVTINYQDDFGEKEIKTEINLYITGGDSKIIYILAVLAVLAIIGWLVFYLFRIKKSKDKIIHQLLKEPSEKKKIPKRK